MNNKLSVQDVDRCVKCGDERRFSKNNEEGVCEKYFPARYCRCYCEFPSLVTDKNPFPGASDHSQTAVPEDNQYVPTHTPIYTHSELAIAKKLEAVRVKAALIERVREWGDYYDSQERYSAQAGQTEKAAEHAVRAETARMFAAELEAVELTQDTESAEGGDNPELTLHSQASLTDSKSSESESTLVTAPDVQAAPIEGVLPCPLEHEVVRGVASLQGVSTWLIVCRDCNLTLTTSMFSIIGEDKEETETLWNTRSPVQVDEVSKEQDNAES